MDEIAEFICKEWKEARRPIRAARALRTRIAPRLCAAHSRTLSRSPRAALAQVVMDDIKFSDKEKK
jgi:hypothetical protein